MIPNSLPNIDQPIYFYTQSRDELENAYSDYLSNNSFQWQCKLQKKSNIKDIDTSKDDKDNSNENKEVKENFEGKDNNDKDNNDKDNNKINEKFENISKKSLINLLYIFIPFIFSIVYIMVKLGVNNTWDIWFPFNLIINKSKMVRSILFFLLASFVLFLVVSYFYYIIISFTDADFSMGTLIFVIFSILLFYISFLYTIFKYTNLSNNIGSKFYYGWFKRSLEV